MSSKQKHAHHDTNQGNDTVTQWSKQSATRVYKCSQGDSYHPRRAALVCPIIPGETDDGGLATRMPVLGLTIGMAPAFRADGWKIFRLLLLMKLGGGAYADVAAEDKDRAGVICCCGWICCCSGEDSGDPLERDERSDEAECIDCLSSKVRR